MFLIEGLCARSALVLAVCATVWSAPVAADVDLNGPWRVNAETSPYFNPNLSCIVDVVQVGTALTVTGNECSLPINLTGTIDPPSGAFSLSGASNPFFCPSLTITGNATPAGDGFSGTFSCTGIIPVTGPFTAGLCANDVLDAGEDCDDGDLNIGDCCSATCDFDPSNYSCYDGTDCTTSLCDGAGTCVHDPAPAGMRCESDFNGCTDDVCDAVGNCTHEDSAAGTECSIDFNVCTDDRCDGNGACLTTPNSAPCSDDNTCTLGDQCAGGSCVPGTGLAPAGIRCNTDFNHCTVDECDGAGGCSNVGCSLCCGAPGCNSQVSASCADAGAAKLIMKSRPGEPERDGLTFKWAGTSPLGDFGTPTASTSYEICLYETVYNPQATIRVAFQARAEAAGMCAGKPCWKGAGAGFSYKDPELDPEGLHRLRLRSSGGDAKISVLGKGANIGWQRLDFFDSPLTMQLKASNGECWGATFDTFDRNTGRKIKATTGD